MCPSRVAQTVVAINRFGPDGVLEPGQLAGTAAYRQLSIANHGDPGRVVAAIFELAKALEEDGHNRFRAEVTDNAAHGVILYSVFF